MVQLQKYIDTSLMGHQAPFPALAQGAVVVITGASSGLGREIALAFANKNVKLVLAGRDHTRLASVKQECLKSSQSTVQIFEGDLTIPENCKKLIAFVNKLHHRIDFLVLNAGVNAHFTFSNIQDLSVYESLMKVNFYANVYLTRFALPIVKASKGAIVVISSLSGKFGLPSRSAYCASKFALNGFFQSLRTEEDLPIMMVYPTSLQTPMRNNSLIKAKASEETEKREDPKKCASMVVQGLYKKKEEIYLPKKGWLGVVLQPIFPRLMRWKVSQAAKL